MMEDPAATAPPAPEAGFGPNNEDLPEDLRESLHKIVAELFDESSIARRDEVARIKKAREFWRGNQYVYYDHKDGRYKIPTHEQRLKADRPYQYVTNIYQAFGLTIIAALSQSVPKVKFWPQSPTQEDDIATADAATAIAELVQRNNRMDQLLIKESWHLWTDGAVGGYVRWVVDADRFGVTEKPILEPQEAEIEPGQPGSMTCPECQTQTPDVDGSMEQAMSAGAGTPDEMGMGGGMMNCPTCQMPLGPENFAPPTPPLMGMVSKQVGVEKIPNGQVVIDMIGKLELRLPSYANDLRDAPYIAWVTEVHKSKIKAAYPKTATKIDGSSDITSSNETNERQARISLVAGRKGLATGGDLSKSLVTFQRVWLRPFAFESEKDKAKREQLKTLFPKGCYVAFADDEYCESREEAMDDCWRLEFAMPGDGANREALGGSMISIQERYNTLKNITTETIERGIPVQFADRDVLNLKAYKDGGARIGQTIGVRPKAGMSVESAFHETKPLTLSEHVVRESQELVGEIGQFESGAFPALFGGGALNTETAAGYAMQRDQAMGRLGMVYRQMREFHSDLVQLAVQCFKKNRKEAMEVALLGPEGKWDSKLIRIEDLQGNFFAYPEADENFPESFSQKKSGLLQVIEKAPQLLEAAAQSPNAYRAVWKLLGVKDVKLPGEEARQKQYREIQELLQGQPMLPQPQIDPQTGQPIPAPPTSSVPIDAEFDDHATEFETIREWIWGPAGQDARVNNPVGFENVRAHGLEHKAILDMQAQQQALAQQAAQAPPPGEMNNG